MKLLRRGELGGRAARWTKFPGLLVQGDTFATIVEAVRAVSAGAEESSGALEELRERLEAMERFYAETLTAEGFEIPYRRE